MDKYKIVENIFFKLGAKSDNKDIMHLLEQIRNKILDKIQSASKSNDTSKLGILCYGLECLLKYQRSSLLTPEHIFLSLDALNSLFTVLITQVKVIISDEDIDKYKD